jgi:hypothetical protein
VNPSTRRRRGRVNPFRRSTPASPATTLEVLYAARDRLRGGADYNYWDFATCTCGHIYTAVTGRVDEGAPSYPTGVYADIILNVARHLKDSRGKSFKGKIPDEAAAWVSFVSAGAFNDVGRPRDPEIGLIVINRAIAAIEERERAAVNVVAAAVGSVATTAHDPSAVPVATTAHDRPLAD